MSPASSFETVFEEQYANVSATDSVINLAFRFRLARLASPSHRSLGMFSVWTCPHMTILIAQHWLVVRPPHSKHHFEHVQLCKAGNDSGLRHFSRRRLRRRLLRWRQCIRIRFGSFVVLGITKGCRRPPQAAVGRRWWLRRLSAAAGYGRGRRPAARRRWRPPPVEASPSIWDSVTYAARYASHLLIVGRAEAVSPRYWRPNGGSSFMIIYLKLAPKPFNQLTQACTARPAHVSAWATARAGWRVQLFEKVARKFATWNFQWWTFQKSWIRSREAANVDRFSQIFSKQLTSSS